MLQCKWSQLKWCKDNADNLNDRREWGQLIFLDEGNSNFAPISLLINKQNLTLHKEISIC